MDDTIKFNDGTLKFSSEDDKAWSDWYSPSDFFGAPTSRKADDVIFLGDYKSKTQLEGPHDRNDAWLSIGDYQDNVEHPFHYTQGKQEAIDIIEDAIAEAPGSKQGFLQGQVLKYILRLWLKADAKEDAQKARWYLNRLIDSLN